MSVLIVTWCRIMPFISTLYMTMRVEADNFFRHLWVKALQSVENN